MNWNQRQAVSGLARFTPLAFVAPNSPLFRFETRGLSYGRDADALMSRMFQRMRLIVSATMATTLAFIVLGLALSSGDGWYEFLWYGIGALFAAGFLDRFYLDFSAAAMSLDTVSRDIDAGRFDLIALTDVSARNVTRAKYAVAQIRAWRLLATAMGVRLAAVMSGAVALIVTPLIAPRRDDVVDIYAGFAELFDESADVALASLLVIGCLVILLGVYVIEPRWRLYPICAASVAVSTQRQAPAFALFSVILCVGWTWVAQIVALGATILILVLTLSLLITPICGGMYLVFVFSGAAFGLRQMYTGMSDFWLNRARKRIWQLGGAP